MEHFALPNVNAYFEEIKQYSNIILFGCGGKGREAVPILAEYGIRITAACDNNHALWGQEFVDGVRIQPFEQAVAADADCCVIIAATVIYAVDIGEYITRKYPSVPIYHLCSPFKVESGLLPEKDARQRKAEIRDCCNLLMDKESQKIFLDTLNWKLTGNMLPLTQYPLGYTDYSFFDEDIIQTDSQSVYVDVGAYTGDTIACFLMFSRGKFKKIIGVEADRGNYSALDQFVKFSKVERIKTYNFALWSKEEKKTFYTNSENRSIHFGSSNLFQSVDKIADNLSMEQMRGKLKTDTLYVKTLDGLLKDETPTIMKINALAADREIILGGQQILRNYKPTLILEFGVAKGDVFELIPLIKQINKEYRFYLRRKKVFEDIKTVLYCV